MGREEQNMELTLISAQEVKRVSKFSQQTCYAVAYISETKKKTRVDRQGGVNPVWNEKLILSCDESLLQRAGKYVTVEIYSHGSMSNKLIGFVKIPLVDIAQEGKGPEPKYMAYQLRRPSGKVKGVLNLSVKLGRKHTVATVEEKLQQQFPHAYPGHAGEYDSYRRNASPVSYPQQYPPPAFYQSTLSSNSLDRNVPPAVPAVYPPQQAVVRHETDAVPASEVYPPPRPSSSSGNSSLKQEEPVMAYPSSGYPPQQHAYGQNGAMYTPAQYGSGRNDYAVQYPQRPGRQYYPAPQASDPYNYQQAYYSKPSRRQGSSGLGLGLLGGALGGLVVGDAIGDAF